MGNCEIASSACHDKRDEVKTMALASPSVKKYLGEQLPRKVIVVAGKLVNIVV